MNIILTTGILLVAASLALRKSKIIPPFWGFLFVFIIMGFQEGVEGDFMGYKEIFNTISTLPGNTVVGESQEWGWYYLLKIFSLFPFWFFVVCLAGFQSMVLIKLCQRNITNGYEFLPAILFFFTFNMMLMQMKALGQGVAIETIILSFLLIDRNKLWAAFFSAILAFLIHNSAIVMFPVVIFYYFVKQKGNSNKLLKFFDKRFLPFIMTGIYVFLFIIKQTFFGQYFNQLALGMLEGSGLHYAGYLDEMNTAEGFQNFMDNSISPLIVLYDGIIVFLVSWFYRYTNPQLRVFALISIISAIGDMLFFGLGSLYRIFMYFTVFNIVVYPALARQIKVKYGVIALFLFIALIVGYAMKTSIPWMLEAEAGRFGTYHFVFMK